MASERVRLADIREIPPHTMGLAAEAKIRALVDALDAVLAVKFDTHANSWSTDSDHGFAQGMALAKERVLAAIESVRHRPGRRGPWLVVHTRTAGGATTTSTPSASSRPVAPASTAASPQAPPGVRTGAPTAT